MRALVPVLLSVAAFHSALSASLEGVEKEEKVVYNDGLTELQKVDQVEFEAAQKQEAAQMNDQTQFEAAQKEDAVHVNVTVGDNEDTRYLEAHKDGCEEQRREPAHVNTGANGSPGAVNRDETKSSEETEEHLDGDSVSSSDEVAQDTRSKTE